MGVGRSRVVASVEGRVLSRATLLRRRKTPAASRKQICFWGDKREARAEEVYFLTELDVSPCGVRITDQGDAVNADLEMVKICFMKKEIRHLQR